MKKIIFAALTLMVLAGSTFTVPTFTPKDDVVAQTKKKTTVSPDDIPPPNCPIDDPNGCGIYS